MPRRWNSPTSEDRKRIAELYQGGHSISQVEEAAGFSRNTIRKVLEELGIPRRPQGHAMNRIGATPRQDVQPVLIKRAVPGLPGSTARQEPIGNCVRCRRRIAYGMEYRRIPGVLGKVCADCVDGDHPAAAGDQSSRAHA